MRMARSDTLSCVGFVAALEGRDELDERSRMPIVTSFRIIVKILSPRPGRFIAFSKAPSNMRILSPYSPMMASKENIHLLVSANRMIQYTTNTGQNTGTLKTSNHEHRNPMAMALVAACQNLNSGSRRMKGRNSSSCFVGNEDCPPSSMDSSWLRDGSNLGCRKARKRLRR